jgi:hypothetical protein
MVHSVWILQELARSKVARAKIDSHEISSYDTFICALFMRRNHWRPGNSDRRRKVIQRAVDVYSYNTRNPSQLLTHIKRTAAFNATDPRNKVFGAWSSNGIFANQPQPLQASSTEAGLREKDFCRLRRCWPIFPVIPKSGPETWDLGT